MNKISTTVRLIALAFVATLTFAAPAAQASSTLGSAFERLTGASGGSFTTSNEAAFRTRTRTGFSAGGATVRFSQKRYSLVQVSPPSYSAGCHGIDLHFGGFSFINAEEITQMLNQILNGALAVAFDMAITALCPPCDKAMQWANDLAEKAKSMAINSCEASEALVAATKMAVTDPKKLGQKMTCSTVGMASGKYSDWIESKKEACKDSAAESLSDDLENGTEGDRQKAAALVGNMTWQTLQASGLAPKTHTAPNQDLKPYAEIMMSWVGTSIGGGGPNAAPDGEYPPLIRNADDVLAIFMCGNSAAAAPGGITDPNAIKLQEAATSYCNSMLGDEGIKTNIYTCPDDLCMEMETTPLSDVPGIGPGFLRIVIRELSGAINNVASDQPLTTVQKSLIAQAPFPLYRAINVAAISPEIATSIVMSHAQALSYMIGLEYMKDIFRQARQSSSRSELRPELMLAVTESLSALRDQSFQAVEQLSIVSETSQQIMTSVEKINKAALANNMALGITGSSFARAAGGN